MIILINYLEDAMDVRCKASVFWEAFEWTRGIDDEVEGLWGFAESRSMDRSWIPGYGQPKNGFMTMPRRAISDDPQVIKRIALAPVELFSTWS